MTRSVGATQRREKGIKHFPRKLPNKRSFKSVIDRFKKPVTDVRDVRPRAELCLKMGGGHFESQLKKYKRGTIEE